jgi:hypothetical protein
VIRRKLLTIVAALCGVAGSVLVSPGTGLAGVKNVEQQRTEAIAARTAAAEYLVRFENRHSGKCLGIASGSRLNGAQALQWTCNGDSNQYWLVRYTNKPIAEVKNWGTGKCLAIASGSLANGGLALQWTCNNRTDQKWQVPDMDVQGRVYNANSGLCLSIESASLADGARALQWTCGRQPDQQWTVNMITEV